MKARPTRRLLLIAGALVIAFSLIVRFNQNITANLFPTPTRTGGISNQITITHLDISLNETQGQIPTGLQDVGSSSATHRELFSLSTLDKKYFPIDFGDHLALNPNIIPHPHLKEVWIIVAQEKESTVFLTVWHAEIVCNAGFEWGTLRCLKPPSILPIAATTGNNCPKKDPSGLAMSVGPHDARVFYGPTSPFTIYGSNSDLTCFGMWLVDFRLLVDWGLEGFKNGEFRKATELQKPGRYQVMEKNWFIFWDSSGQKYVHHDIYPTRSFSKLKNDGSVGKDLSPRASSDKSCLKRLMPTIASVAAPDKETIHQATNSLSITLCKRSDPACKVNDFTTFIFHIFQHKKYYQFRGIYEPYVMLFQRMAPFGMHGISRKPFWIHGRDGKQGNSKRGTEDTQTRGDEMFYVTSMSWKDQAQKYHGYIDDILFISFGIEDTRTGGIDILAGDLLQDLSFCSS